MRMAHGAVVGRIGGIVRPAIARTEPAPGEADGWGLDPVGAEEDRPQRPAPLWRHAVALALVRRGAGARTSDRAGDGAAEGGERPCVRVDAEDRHSWWPVRSRLVSR